MFRKNVLFLNLVMVHSRSTSIGKCVDDGDNNGNSNITLQNGGQKKKEK